MAKGWEIGGFSKGTINRKNLEAMLTSPQIDGLIKDAAGRSTEGMKTYLAVERIPGKVGVKGKKPDRVGYKIFIKPEWHHKQGVVNLKNMANMLMTAKNRKFRKRTRAPRRSRAKNYVQKKGD